MKPLTVSIYQYSLKGSRVFFAEGANLKFESEDDLVGNVVNFIMDNFRLTKNLKGIKMYSRSINSIRLSYPIHLGIINEEAEINLRIVLINYKHFLKNNDPDGLFNLIKSELANYYVDIEEDLLVPTSNPIDISSSHLFGNSCPENLEIEFLDDLLLTEFEVFSICRGLENKYHQILAGRFFEGYKPNSQEFLECLEMAKQAISKYGKRHIEFLISLPQMPFKTKDFKPLFCEIERNRINQGKPELILTLSQIDKNESLLIRYFNPKQKSTLLVIDNNTQKEICRINRNGYIIPNPESKKIVPVIRLLVETSETTAQKIVYYGHRTGNCYMCSRKLTDLESVKIGLGPICRRALLY